MLRTPIMQVAILLAAIVFLTGCHSNANIGLVLEAGNNASVKVRGSNPFVMIDNEGPADVEVVFAPTNVLPNGPRFIAAKTSTGRTMSNGGQVNIINASEESTVVRVIVKNHDGVSVKSGSPPVTSEQ